MAPNDVKSEVEKLSVERKSFEITSNEISFQQDELSPEDREFLDTFGDERRKAVIRKVKHAKLISLITSKIPWN
jgi:hypothetical protein